MKKTKYKTKLDSKEIIFDVLYNLKSHTLADDKTRYFTDISEIRYKGVNLLDILDRTLIDNIRVDLFKRNNDINEQ
tara:strand:- start:8115 stop:8342 length:228 start_codon:yes stop_codon:yes gene_type:complete